MRPAAPNRGPLMVMDSDYPITGGGGAENQVGTLGRWFNANGYPTRLIVPMFEHRVPVTDEVIDGLSVHRIPYPRLRVLGSLILQLRLFIELWRVRRDTPAIYAHIGSWMAVVCCVAGRLFGIPVLVKMTGSTELVGGPLDPKAGLVARIMRAGLGLATGFQATSREIAEALATVGMPTDRIHRIVNAVQMERFETDTPGRRAMREAICPGARFIALFIGRLEPVKGLDLLFEAWALALRQDPLSWLVLVGSGQQEQALREQCERLGIESRVVFAGQIASVEHYMGWADIAVLPSWKEGLSNAMLECMAAGLPMLGSRVSGTEDFVRPWQTGWLFEPGNVGELAQRLSQARTAGPSLVREMGRQAHDEIASRASLDAVALQLLAVLSLPVPPELEARRHQCVASPG